MNEVQNITNEAQIEGDLNPTDALANPELNVGNTGASPWIHTFDTGSIINIGGEMAFQKEVPCVGAIVRKNKSNDNSHVRASLNDGSLCLGTKQLLIELAAGNNPTCIIRGRTLSEYNTNIETLKAEKLELDSEAAKDNVDLSTGQIDRLKRLNGLIAAPFVAQIGVATFVGFEKGYKIATLDDSAKDKEDDLLNAFEVLSKTDVAKLSDEDRKVYTAELKQHNELVK
jgi:hypothetical protein